MQRKQHRVVIAALVAAVAGATAAAQDRSEGMVEWPTSEPTRGHRSTLRWPTSTFLNVDRLEAAWTWEPNELPNQEFRTRLGSFEVMPLMIGNVVYVSTMYTRVVAPAAFTSPSACATFGGMWDTGTPLRHFRSCCRASCVGIPATPLGLLLLNRQYS